MPPISGACVWEKRTGSEDLLFSELMIWGYLHRWRTQRRLASALDMLGPMSQSHRRALDGLSTSEQAKLLEQLVAGVETRDPYLHGHSRRVARHSWMIARRMGLSRAEVAQIRTAAAIHDVGKVKTPKAILHKAGPLTVEEYEVIKRHPGDGALMAAVLRDPELTSMVRHHHERLDGTGYPDGLSGEEIPLGARIIAVADTFDAITSARPYRPASPHKKAIDILRNEAGTRLDPAVVRAFCGHYAGRRPLALWALVAGLPERVVAWLGSSVATVASAAKVVAVAALVGGAAVTTSTLGLPVAKHHPTKAHSAPTARPHAQTVKPTPGGALVHTGSAVTPRSRRAGRVRHTTVRAPVTAGSPTSQPAASAPGGAVGAQPSQPVNNGGGSGQGTGPGKTEPPGKPKGEPPAKTELPGKPTGEPPAKTEPPGQTEREPRQKANPRQNRTPGQTKRRTPWQNRTPGNQKANPLRKPNRPAKAKAAPALQAKHRQRVAARARVKPRDADCPATHDTGRDRKGAYAHGANVPDERWRCDRQHDTAASSQKRARAPRGSGRPHRTKTTRPAGPSARDCFPPKRASRPPESPS